MKSLRNQCLFWVFLILKLLFIRILIITLLLEDFFSNALDLAFILLHIHCWRPLRHCLRWWLLWSIVSSLITTIFLEFFFRDFLLFKELSTFLFCFFCYHIVWLLYFISFVFISLSNVGFYLSWSLFLLCYRRLFIPLLLSCSFASSSWFDLIIFLLPTHRQ